MHNLLFNQPHAVKKQWHGLQSCEVEGHNLPLVVQLPRILIKQRIKLFHV